MLGLPPRLLGGTSCISILLWQHIIQTLRHLTTTWIRQPVGLSHAGGIDDLLKHLSAGYKIANDVKFVAFIDIQESNYLQGSDLTPELLMTNALNDYNTKIIQNTWGLQSEKQRQIVALSAALKTRKDDSIELSQSVLKKVRSQRNSNSNRGNRSDAVP